jgi:hypothetical protein
MRIAGFSEEEIDNADLSELLSMQKAMSSPYDMLGRYLMLHAEYTVLISNPPKDNNPQYQQHVKTTREKLLGTYNPLLTINKRDKMIELNNTYGNKYDKQRGAKK